MPLAGKVVIGITPAFDEGVKLPASKSSLYLRREYTKLIAELGAVPLILSPDMHMTDILTLCDGVIISGGEDIPAEVYGGDELLTVPEPLERIMWERLLIDRCQESSVPILGVCYGMQLLALHFGGALFQDIETELPGSYNHAGTTHDVRIERNFLGIGSGETLHVNSRHHQAVATLPDNFALCAVSTDGVIEAMCGEHVYGVQWHPESDETGRGIYRAFIERCGG
ncbi:gamma-glutamyl-gamma-aminobutyrate hydrolase family protein [Candidatus Saccharibacteria bacterium]|nr:gamma-glutamyl-gamma-aminobutyrate hydrolase family protein [Candidatus Saccharibacteria bacterium]